MKEQELIYVVDDDPAVLKSLWRLLRSAGYEVATFSSPGEFLVAVDAGTSGCAVLDLAMPGLDGLELQRALQASGCDLPVLFLTGHRDIPSSVRAIKAGAVDFLTKPVEDEALLAAVRRALETGRAARRANRGRDDARRRLETLTPREREVLEGVVAGKLNKQIAADLGIAEKTVKVHRGRVMHKLEVSSVADLVHLANRARLRST